MAKQTDDTDQFLADLEADAGVEAKDATDLRAIGEALDGMDSAEQTLRDAVTAAHAGGRSWTEIANVLGVSRQAARQRFAVATEAGR